MRVIKLDPHFDAPPQYVTTRYEVSVRTVAEHLCVV